MGKFTDALEKIEKAESLTVLSLAKSSAQQAPTKTPTKVPIVAPPEPPRAQRPTAAKTAPPTGQYAPDRIDSHLVVYHDPTSVESETFKILRNSILFPKQGEKPVLIMVTSAIPGDGNPSEPLSSQSMRHLLEQVKNRYSDRYVIVDSPPPQLTAETTALANYVDAIIVVVKYSTTPKEMVKELVDNVDREKVIGVVMNGYRVPTTERYGYGRYKAYRYKKSSKSSLMFAGGGR